MVRWIRFSNVVKVYGFGIGASVDRSRFRVEKTFDFNRVSVLGWWFNGKLLRRKSISRVQLKILDILIPSEPRRSPLALEWPKYHLHWR